MTWKDLFTTYGSFTTLILLGVGYFIQRFFNLKSKKVETNYSFFQQNKINAITKFFDCYNKVERMWHAFSIHKVVNREFSTIEMDSIVWPIINPLKMSLLELSLYLSENDCKPFQTIYGNVMDVNRVVSDIYFKNKEGNSLELSNEYSFKLLSITRENDKLLQQIGKQNRSMFNADNK